jgi:hypothetical protein
MTTRNLDGLRFLEVDEKPKKSKIIMGESGHETELEVPGWFPNA